ncbi:MAG: ferric reductase-like transmembrane domain-containing protein [Tannerella sp.]|nr:ferric reductase-like transmembrane domain-containing protein [Tannerella sp.]
MAIPFALVAIPFVARMCGIEMAGFNRVPFLGEIMRDYIHMGTFGHPLLIIIMYMGALNPKIPSVGKLMSIRKELSIICGFPVLTHSLIRVFNNLPGALKFFTDNEEYLANTKVVSEAGAGISSFSYILGILMLLIFIPLWVTSFGAVRKRMGGVKWKKLQRWSYVLYATLFIHAMCIAIGGMLNPRGGGASKQTPAVEATATTGEHAHGGHGESAMPVAGLQREQEHKSAKSESEGQREHTESARKGQGEAVNSERGRQGQTQQTAGPATSGGRMPSKGFADIEVSAQAKRYIHMFSLVLIFGSYLFLRLRKARKDAARKNKTSV